MRLMSAISVRFSSNYSFFSLSVSSMSGKVQVRTKRSPSDLLAQPSHLKAHLCKMCTIWFKN